MSFLCMHVIISYINIYEIEFLEYIIKRKDCETSKTMKRLLQACNSLIINKQQKDEFIVLPEDPRMTYKWPSQISLKCEDMSVVILGT